MNIQTLPSKMFSFLFVWILFTFVACFPESKNSESEKVIISNDNINSIYVSRKQFQSSGMELGNVQKIGFNEEIRTNGMFDVPPAHRAAVSVYFGGTVKNFDIHVGDKVKKGQVLFILENPEYVQLQQDYLEVKAQLSYLKSDYERQKTLALESLSSQKIKASETIHADFWRFS